jgi:hypothetical protein
MTKSIYSMNPETRSAFLASFAGPKTYDVAYGKNYRRTVRCTIVAVAPSLSSSIAHQLVVRSAYGGDYFTISTAEVISVTEV